MTRLDRVNDVVTPAGGVKALSHIHRAVEVVCDADHDKVAEWRLVDQR